jgi:uncharacterized protein with HEPN domain
LPSSNPYLTLGDIIESRISEAAVKLGAQAEELAPGPKWSDIHGIGNHLRHGYRGVRRSAIWQTVCDDLAPLREANVAAQHKLAARKPD